MNCPENQYFFLNPHPTLWLGVLGLKISKSLRNSINCRENGLILNPQPPPSRRGRFRGNGEGREEEGRSKEAGKEEGGRREERGRSEGGGEAGGRTKVRVRELEGRKLSGGRKGGGREGM